MFAKFSFKFGIRFVEILQSTELFESSSRTINLGNLINR